MTEEAKEARREYQKAYRAANRDKCNAYKREWRKKNPDKEAAIAARYWTRKAAGAVSEAGAKQGEQVNQHETF